MLSVIRAEIRRIPPVDLVVNRHGKPAVNRAFLNGFEAVVAVSPLDR